MYSKTCQPNEATKKPILDHEIMYVKYTRYLMKDSLFWVVTPLNPVWKLTDISEEYFILIFRARNHRDSGSNRSLLLVWLVVRPTIQRWNVPPKSHLILNGLHHVTSQKIEPFMATTVRISNLTCSSQSQSQSQSELLYYDWRFTANQFVLATSPFRLTTSSFIFKLNSFGYSPYVTSSLTRGWLCRLQLLLVLASAVILRSESRGTHDHILLSQIRDSPNPEGQVPVFISPKTGCPSYTPRHRVPFPSPFTTRRATVEIFDAASHTGFHMLYTIH
jgi:hypothetical protein